MTPARPFVLFTIAWLGIGLWSFGSAFTYAEFDQINRHNAGKEGIPPNRAPGEIRPVVQAKAWASPSLLARFSEEDLGRMAAGGVAVSVDRSPGSHKGTVDAAIIIDASPEPIWASMTDCAHAPDFIPNLISCRVLERHGDMEIIEHQVKFSWLLPRLTYIFRAGYEKYRKISFRRIRGDLRELEGSWTLEPIDEGRRTVVLYSVYLDPGFFLPQWLIRMSLQRDLPELLLALRHRVYETQGLHRQE